MCGARWVAPRKSNMAARFVSRSSRVCRRALASSALVSPPAAGTTRLAAWGNGKHGLLLGADGDGKGRTLVPAASTTLGDAREGDPVLQVSVGAAHAGMVTESGALLTVGDGKYGRLGHGDAASQPVPLEVDGFPSRVVQVAAGTYHTAALTANGEVYTWGWGGSFVNGQGALGHGNKKSVSRPTRVEALRGEFVRQIECGPYHTIVVAESGSVFSWGRGEGGRLGTPNAADARYPQELELLHGHKIVKVGAGKSFSAALSSAGKMFTWGRNNGGQLGMPAEFNMDVLSMEKMPQMVETISRQFVVDISLGLQHCLALDADGDVWFWGDKQWPVPHRTSDNVKGAKNEFARQRYVAICGGHKTSAAIDDQGRVWTWGDNKFGALGQGWTSKMVRMPTLVEGFGRAKDGSAPLGRAAAISAGKTCMMVVARTPKAGGAK